MPIYYIYLYLFIIKMCHFHWKYLLRLPPPGEKSSEIEIYNKRYVGSKKFCQVHVITKIDSQETSGGFARYKYRSMLIPWAATLST